MTRRVMDILSATLSKGVAVGGNGDGVTDDRATLQASIDTGDKIIIINKPHFIGSNITFPENIVVRFEIGGKLITGTGVRVTFRSNIEAGEYNIFSGSKLITFSRFQRSIKSMWFKD